MGKWGKGLSLLLLFIIILAGCSMQDQKIICVEVWHHYDGAQKIAFDNLVTEFNETEGMEKGIIVEGFNQGSIDHLETKIINTIDNNVGFGEPPNILATCPDIAYKMDNAGILVDLEGYLKKNEIKNYVQLYIEECYMGNEKKLKMFPIAKSTDIMMINKTDWDVFEAATGANIKDLETWEGLCGVAERYYNWTDSLTKEPDDGKAFFARDNLANYMLVGAQQLGQRILEIEEGNGIVEVDNDIMRMLWDNYYIPYVNGYYGPFGKYSSDDLKTGEIIAYVGSAGEANYFPKMVTVGSNDSYEIEPLMLPVPNFENTDPYAVLQGTGMVVLKSNEAEERAAIEFLKWFTKAPKNIEFSMTTGYLPVTKSLKDVQTLEKRLDQVDKEKVPDQVKMSLPLAASQVKEYNMHINEAFNNSAEARAVLATSLINRAKGDRVKVVELIDAGMARKEAVSVIATESNFEQWVVRFKMEVKGVVK